MCIELYERHIYDLNENEEDEFDDSDNEEDPRPDMKVGKQLLRMGKVPYRRIEYLPDWVMERKQEISDYRTPRQVRRLVMSCNIFVRFLLSNWLSENQTLELMSNTFY